MGNEGNGAMEIKGEREARLNRTERVRLCCCFLFSALI